MISKKQVKKIEQLPANKKLPNSLPKQRTNSNELILTLQSGKWSKKTRLRLKMIFIDFFYLLRPRNNGLYSYKVLYLLAFQ